MRLWRQTEPGAWLLILSSLLGPIPTAFLIVALPIYLDHLGLHPELIGTLYTVSGIASGILLVVFGILADRYGRKPFVIIGSALPVLSYVILSLTTARTPLLLASAIGGIGLAGGMSGALVTSGYNALLSEKTRPEARTAVFSIAEMAWAVASLIGSLLAALPHLLQTTVGLSYRGAYHAVFLVLIAIGVASALVVLPVHERHHREATEHHWLPRSSGRRILLLATVLGMFGLGLGFIVQLLPLWFHLRFHVSEAYLGPWYGLAQVLALGSLALAAPLSRRMGAVPFVIITQSSASLVLLLMAGAPSASIGVLLWIVRTFVMNASWPVQQAYIMGVVDPRERATAASLTYAAWSICSALSPPVGGALLAARHYTLPFILGAAAYALGIGSFYWFFRRIKAETEDDTLVAYEHLAVAD